MGRIRDAFNAGFPDGPASAPTKPQKSEIRAISGIIEAEVEGAAAGNVGPVSSWAQLAAIAPTRNGQPGYVTTAPIRATRIEPGRLYRVRFVLRRRENPADPSNHNVRLAVRWLSRGKGAIPTATGIVQDIPALTIANGRTEVTAVIARSAGAGVNLVAPAAASTAAGGAKLAWKLDTTITYSGLLALNLSPKVKTIDVEAAKVDDRVYVHRHGYPQLAGVNILAGVMIEGTGFVPLDGKVDVDHVISAVGIAQTLIIPIRILGLSPHQDLIDQKS